MIFLNGVRIVPTQFPDRTSQVWKVDEKLLKTPPFEVRWEFENEAELVHVAQLFDLIDDGKNLVTLYLPYLPYGRQDKAVRNNETFALQTFAKLVRAIGFWRVVAFDPHSEVPIQIIPNFHALYPTKEVDRAFKATKADLLCFPDDGARTKYARLFDVPFVWGMKRREQLSGQITSYALSGNRSVKGKTVLIVDDICDGGRTFTILAEALKRKGAEVVHLYVSHGLFTQGLAPLRAAGIRRIFTKEGERHDPSHSL